MKDISLKKHKRLTRIFLHFMYCNCDIGKKC
ncbi:ABC-three component system protein [Spirobacillus cienkowskii]